MHNLARDVVDIDQFFDTLVATVDQRAAVLELFHQRLIFRIFRRKLATRVLVQKQGDILLDDSFDLDLSLFLFSCLCAL